jgi:hypothetical protein
MEVVIIDARGLLPPNRPGVFEIADQFLLLGVHTDDRQTLVPEMRKLPAVSNFRHLVFGFPSISRFEFRILRPRRPFVHS